jgi:hypothetical protein
MKRVICMISLLCIITTACQILDPGGRTPEVTGDYFPLAIGNTWNYERSVWRYQEDRYESIQSRTVSIIEGGDDGWAHARRILTYYDDGRSDSSVVYLRSADALVQTHIPDDPTTYDTLYTVPIQLGGSWFIRGWDNVGPMTVVSVDTTVTVPAGRFSNVVVAQQRLTLRWHGGSDLAFWARYYAPGVGEIAIETITYRDGERFVEDRWELTSY